MKRTILITTLLISAITPAVADLQVEGTDSELGTPCYSDDRYTLLFKINDPDDIFAIGAFSGDECPTSYNDWRDSPEGECWIRHTGDALYTCSKTLSYMNASGDCPYMSAWTNHLYDETWQSIGANRVMIPDGETTESIGEFTCTANMIKIYGCDAGYYTTATPPDENMTCQACPTLGTATGHSEIGNTDITGCYIPADSTFSDSSGSGIISGDCYYKE